MFIVLWLFYNYKNKTFCHEKKKKMQDIIITLVENLEFNKIIFFMLFKFFFLLEKKFNRYYPHKYLIPIYS